MISTLDIRENTQADSLSHCCNMTQMLPRTYSLLIIASYLNRESFYLSYFRENSLLLLQIHSCHYHSQVTAMFSQCSKLSESDFGAAFTFPLMKSTSFRSFKRLRKWDPEIVKCLPSFILHIWAVNIGSFWKEEESTKSYLWYLQCLVHCAEWVRLPRTGVAMYDSLWALMIASHGPTSASSPDSSWQGIVCLPLLSVGIPVALSDRPAKIHHQSIDHWH